MYVCVHVCMCVSVLTAVCVSVSCIDTHRFALQLLQITSPHLNHFFFFFSSCSLARLAIEHIHKHRHSLARTHTQTQSRRCITGTRSLVNCCFYFFSFFSFKISFSFALANFFSFFFFFKLFFHQFRITFKVDKTRIQHKNNKQINKKKFNPNKLKLTHTHCWSRCCCRCCCCFCYCYCCCSNVLFSRYFGVSSPFIPFQYTLQFISFHFSFVFALFLLLAPLLMSSISLVLFLYINFIRIHIE